MLRYVPDSIPNSLCLDCQNWLVPFCDSRGILFFMKLIPLSTRTGNKNKGKHFAMVDDDVYPYLIHWNWTAEYYKEADTYYAQRTYYPPNYRKGTWGAIKIKMHRFILGITDPAIHIDHADHNGLNNQGYNLRPGTSLQNMMNKKPYKNGASAYKGVTWRKDRCKWKAMITVYGKTKSVGSFTSEIQAAKAYDQAAIKYFGERAFLNFPLAVTGQTPLRALQA